MEKERVTGNKWRIRIVVISTDFNRRIDTKKAASIAFFFYYAKVDSIVEVIRLFMRILFIRSNLLKTEKG